MFFNRDRDPILVEVSDGRYNCYGVPTARSVWLTALLKSQGGINESVEDGYYHYNAKLQGLNWVVSLTPYKE